tara:strand:- start:1263 stop:1490 length:228 start_codon:yes stop_codon:yes gene_type:complete
MFNLILYNLLMNKKKAKVIFKHNSFDIIENGDFVLCAISGKKINIQELTYWNVELQEAYFSSVEANQRFENLKKS